MQPRGLWAAGLDDIHKDCSNLKATQLTENRLEVIREWRMDRKGDSQTHCRLLSDIMCAGAP